MRIARPDRRRFLATAGAFLGAGPFHALACRIAETGGAPEAHESAAADVGYGPLSPVADGTTGLPLLHLPPGFRYVTFGWTGDPLDGGLVTPAWHDGMAAFPAANGLVRLVRNHELRDGVAFAPRPLYDPNGGGGTTTLDFDPATGELAGAHASLTGTAVNCAGGPTPWGSWLTCEETVLGPGGDPDYELPHGYIFEVPADGAAGATAEPYRAMGRFVHEAIAIDPATGIVYETEDQRAAGLYRFLPEQPGNLAGGGRLEMLAIDGAPGYDTRTGQTAGTWHPVTWAPIADPDPTEIASDSLYRQGIAGGAATFARLEGIWHGGGRIYIVSTSGGDADAGQVWEYDPAGERILLLFESPGTDVLDMPDNITVSPRGGLVLCEDGPTENYVRGLTLDGGIFPFAKNNVVLEGERNAIAGDFRDREFAGAVYSPAGDWLFVNVQTPGITCAITGPWANGPL